MTDPCEGKYDIVSRLRDHTNRDDNDIAEAAAYIERLRAERDEARRECCLTWESVMGRDSRDVAADKGWDCFKEGT
jgi:hypothetical protein